MNVTRQIIQSHLVSGDINLTGEEIGIKIDQTLTQDATGTLVMLELEAMGLDHVKTELSAQYVDHNVLEVDFKNPDDHLFLLSAAQRFGLWFSKWGNGISHVVHQERFGKPGKTLLGADSHTPAAGAIGMLAIGAGGLEVAMAMAGEPYFFKMPKVWGVKLVGELQPWVSAKDIILELLRRHGVRAGKGSVLEYYGPGLGQLSVMDRHVIANMGTELGATSSVFPSDDKVREYLRSEGREEDWQPLILEGEPDFDLHEEIDLSRLEPMMALPSSPGKVVKVSEEAGKEIYQAYIGSSANPGYRDFAVVSEMVRDRKVVDYVSLDVNPSSNQILANLARDGHITNLVQAGARIHQAGCNGCIGMGQAPATGKISLRTVPRNFPGRSGTLEDSVYLVSPETAAASALTGVITDPRTLGMEYPRVSEPQDKIILKQMLVAPLPYEQARRITLNKGPNIDKIPNLEPICNEETLPVFLKTGDDISTDEILPAGAKVLPFRSNIAKISEFAFIGVDPEYAKRSLKQKGMGHIIVGGFNYGQGSSREHAALAPRYLGLKAVLAKTFARIHEQNLINFGVLPLQFMEYDDYDCIQKGDVLKLENVIDALSGGKVVNVVNQTRSQTYKAVINLTDREVESILSGGLLNATRRKLISPVSA